MSTNDNPTVYPYYPRCVVGEELPQEEPGIRLRDYFAGQALAGLSVERARSEAPELAADAYIFADAMLAERAKGKEGT